MDGMGEYKHKKLNDVERAALAQQLDDELEEFMQQMASKRAADGEKKKPFDFDEWCKEIETHPCFMTDKSDVSHCLDGKYGDTVAALQALKYDDEDNEDKQFTAEKHKNEGNKHFQLKKYRWATDCYTSGIKVKCLDRKLNGILYCNRAAAQKYIGNLRSAIKDCAMGRRFDPTNLKGVIRGAECMLELGYGSQALDWIDCSKKLFAFHKETEEDGNVTENETKQLDTLEELNKKAMEVVEVQERDGRKRRAQEKKELDAKKKLLSALKERNLNLRPRLPFDHPEMFDWSLLTVSIPQMKQHEIVQFDPDGTLIWPLLVQYPQVGEVDFLTECNENTLLGELLGKVFETPAEWDTNGEYRLDNVRFFVTSEYDEFLIEVQEWMDIKTIISTPNYQVRQGLPVVMVFTKAHVAETFKSEEGVNQFTVS